MKWQNFLELVQSWPIIETEALKVHLGAETQTSVQMSRWVKEGKLISLRQGFYCLAPLYQKMPVTDLALASLLKKPSYISLHKALEFYQLIPESVNLITSVSSKSQAYYKNDFGHFQYQHIQPKLFWGMKLLSLKGQQNMIIAEKEKALLDLFYFHSGEISYEYLQEMRFEHLDSLDWKKLDLYTQRFNKAKITRAVKRLKKFWQNHNQGEQDL